MAKVTLFATTVALAVLGAACSNQNRGDQPRAAAPLYTPMPPAASNSNPLPEAPNPNPSLSRAPPMATDAQDPNMNPNNN